MSERTFVYAIGREEGPVKIGITTNLRTRLQSIQTGCPFRIELLYVCTSWTREGAVYVEKRVHQYLEKGESSRLSGEWFDVGESEVQDAFQWVLHEEPLLPTWLELYDLKRSLALEAADALN